MCQRRPFAFVRLHRRRIMLAFRFGRHIHLRRRERLICRWRFLFETDAFAPVITFLIFLNHVPILTGFFTQPLFEVFDRAADAGRIGTPSPSDFVDRWGIRRWCRVYCRLLSSIVLLLACVFRRKKFLCSVFVKCYLSIRRLAGTVAQLVEKLRYTWPRLGGSMMWRKWLTDEFTLTKRHFGVLLLIAGLALLAAAVLAEVVRSGPDGIGQFKS